MTETLLGAGMGQSNGQASQSRRAWCQTLQGAESREKKATKEKGYHQAARYLRPNRLGARYLLAGASGIMAPSIATVSPALARFTPRLTPIPQSRERAD